MTADAGRVGGGCARAGRGAGSGLKRVAVRVDAPGLLPRLSGQDEDALDDGPDPRHPGQEAEREDRDEQLGDAASGVAEVEVVDTEGADEDREQARGDLRLLRDARLDVAARVGLLVRLLIGLPLVGLLETGALLGVTGVGPLGVRVLGRAVRGGVGLPGGGREVAVLARSGLGVDTVAGTVRFLSGGVRAAGHAVVLSGEDFPPLSWLLYAAPAPHRRVSARV